MAQNSQNTTSFTPLTIHVYVHASTWPRLLTIRMSLIVSAKPTMYIAMATAFAAAKIRPMAPPNSGPRLREIM